MNSNAYSTSSTLRTTARAVAVAFFALWGLAAAAQADTSATTVNVERGRVEGRVEQNPNPGDTLLHSPKKATIMSAVLPGLGQVYNGKWWKVPIIYGGFATAGYFLNDNLKNIDKFKADYIAATDEDPATVNASGFSVEQLDKIIEQYKQWRDLSYIALAAIYILNVVDANVDAHLFYFDVSEDISMQVQPYVSHRHAGPATRGGATAGLTLTLKL